MVDGGALSYFTLMFEFTFYMYFQDIGLVDPKMVDNNLRRFITQEYFLIEIFGAIFGYCLEVSCKKSGIQGVGYIIRRIA